jgi:hypothetical protein
MTRRIFVLLVVLCTVFPMPAEAQVTVHNYVLGSDTSVRANQVHKTDVSGNKLDGFIGQLNYFIQVGTYPNQIFYAYGIVLGCGVRFNAWQNAPPPPTDCGVAVYTSTDWVSWHPIGLLYRPGEYGAICGDSSTNNNMQCFTPGMLPRSDGKYVFWMQGGTAGNTLIVLVCDRPGGEAEGGSCVKQPQPTMYSYVFNTGQVFQDDDGTAYFAYTGHLPIEVMQLNSTYTDGIVSTRDIVCYASCGESVSMFKGPDGTYFVISGTNCAYCTGGSQMHYQAATSALGSYGAQVEYGISGTSCQAQAGIVNRLTLGGGTHVYIQHIAQWTGTSSEALANDFQVPLTFGSHAINPFACVDSFTIAGLTREGQNPDLSIDQTDEAGFFNTDQESYLIDSTQRQMQTFTPSKSALRQFRIYVAQNNRFCPGFGTGSCYGPNGDLTIALDDLDQTTLDPISTIVSRTIPVGHVSWNSVPTTIVSAQVLTPGHHYGIEVSCEKCTGGPTYTVTRALNNPYGGGVARQWVGGRWSTLDGGRTDFKFSTFGSVIDGGGRRHLKP